MGSSQTCGVAAGKFAAQMTSMRTLPPGMIGHAADTAFLRTCGNEIAAPQHMSPDLQFAGDILARNETELSPQPAQT